MAWDADTGVATVSVNGTTKQYNVQDSVVIDGHIMVYKSDFGEDFGVSWNPDGSAVFSRWVDLGKGWRGRVDPPNNGAPGAQQHIHIYDPSDVEVGAWNGDGSISHNSRHSGTVPRGIKRKVKDITGIEIPVKLVPMLIDVPMMPEIPVPFDLPIPIFP